MKNIRSPFHFLKSFQNGMLEQYISLIFINIIRVYNSPVKIFWTFDKINVEYTRMFGMEYVVRVVSTSY